MAQKGIIKNTTTADISAENMAAAFHAMVGKSGILTAFNNLVCTKVSDNSVQIDSGVYSQRLFITCRSRNSSDTCNRQRYGRSKTKRLDRGGTG